MTSQVSFKFDGEHNIQPIVNILKQRLRGLQYKIEKHGYVYRIYVASLETEKETFNVCFGIQSNVVRDYTKILQNN